MTRDSEHLTVMTNFVFVLLLLLQTLIEKLLYVCVEIITVVGVRFFDFPSNGARQIHYSVRASKFSRLSYKLQLYCVGRRGSREGTHTLLKKVITNFM